MDENFGERIVLSLLFIGGIMGAAFAINPVNSYFKTSLGFLLFPAWVIIFGIIGIIRRRTIRTGKFRHAALLIGDEAVRAAWFHIILGILIAALIWLYISGILFG